MKAFLYGVSLQCKLDIRSKTLLITCYIVPLLFFAIMGGITVFGVTMGALAGLPPSLVEIYSGDIKKVYKANGVPLYLGLVLTNISAYIHLFIMSIILYIAAPLAFNARIPENPARYFISLAVFIAVSLSIASVIVPSTMLSGIMFPASMLPKPFETIGKLFPASWGYKLMSESVFKFENLLPLILFFALAVVVCSILLQRIDKY